MARRDARLSLGGQSAEQRTRLVESGLVPLHRRVIHLHRLSDSASDLLESLKTARAPRLVDHHYQLCDAQCLGQLRVLTGLASALKPSLELALAARDDQHAHISLPHAPRQRQRPLRHIL